MRGDLVELIVGCAREIGEQESVELPADFGSDSALFGKRGVFDSLGLVSLVVAVEEAIEDRFGVSLSLADQRAMSQSSSPFRTVGTLAEYADGLLKEAGWGASTGAQ